jgi:ferredoxin-NADP reductase
VTEWQQASVVEATLLTPRIKSFRLQLERPFAFVPGQHVDIRLTADDGYQAMRSYSIASAPDASGSIEIAVERLDDGEVSAFFHEVVAPGDSIELRGPLGGYFLWPAHDDAPILLAGGGSGVVPLLSMVRYRRATGDRRPVLLLYSVRNASDILHADELFALERAGDGFSLVLTITREASTRPGDYGRRVDAAMLAEVLRRFERPPRDAFVCGTNAFVDAVANACIAAGMPDAGIRTERYGG